jgi:TPR repeat protein
MGVKQDYNKAVYWLEKAAEQGITEAQDELDSIHGASR